MDPAKPIEIFFSHIFVIKMKLIIIFTYDINYYLFCISGSFRNNPSTIRRNIYLHDQLEIGSIEAYNRFIGQFLHVSFHTVILKQY